MRAMLWVTVALLASGALVLAAYLLRSKGSGGLLPSVGIADLVGIVSMAINAALFVVTIASLSIAVAAFRASERSGQHQLETLQASRQALQTTADTLTHSAQDFRDSADAGKGQFALLATEKRERDAAVLSTLFGELASNKEAVAENERVLEAELLALKEQRSIIGPLNTLRSSAWELLRVYLPPQIGNNASVLDSVTQIYVLTDRLNEVIRSRENYRIANGAMSNYSTRMKAYDEQLQELDAKFSPLVVELLKTLRAEPKPPGHP